MVIFNYYYYVSFQANSLIVANERTLHSLAISMVVTRLYNTKMLKIACRRAGRGFTNCKKLYFRQYQFSSNCEKRRVRQYVNLSFEH